jgi:Flp pilus assembly pilin Flp
MKSTKKSSKRQGQGMTEYVVIVGLVAILMVGAVSKFKVALEGSYDAATSRVKSEITDKMQ